MACTGVTLRYRRRRAPATVSGIRTVVRRPAQVRRRPSSTTGPAFSRPARVWVRVRVRTTRPSSTTGPASSRRHQVGRHQVAFQADLAPELVGRGIRLDRPAGTTTRGRLPNLSLQERTLVGRQLLGRLCTRTTVLQMVLSFDHQRGCHADTSRASPRPMLRVLLKASRPHQVGTMAGIWGTREVNWTSRTWCRRGPLALSMRCLAPSPSGRWWSW